MEARTFKVISGANQEKEVTREPKLEVNDGGHKDYIFKSLDKKWRDHRFHLYSYAQCDPDGPREANIAKKSPEIPLEQWVAFVDYRAHPDTKAKAAQNTRNRMNLTMPHTLGSKSFDRLQKEMETQLGRSVTRAELFQASHTTLEGSFVNEEARQNHEDLISRSQNSSENEAFTSVFGKDHPGYVKGLGHGVSPTQVYSSSSSSSCKCNASRGTSTEDDGLIEIVQQLRQQVQQHQDQIALLTQQLANQNADLTPNQDNVESPAIGRRSSQGIHSGRGNHNLDHIA
ncbi:uncharacterized protein LOC120268457 [Dioscorea cayenensis subsp. rotundata]|uniref:Uncharacterized protein LOC120268457 n=1 Tax=Dioscorea cayennensis subsp. rotundata TaxID=55577 RepID=A0AB40BWF4_DIOCR|nr:uncharacterized protein LOC120268457 [Dioscorea cayenensis subsp. rotundata]